MAPPVLPEEAGEPVEGGSLGTLETELELELEGRTGTVTLAETEVEFEGTGLLQQAGEMEREESRRGGD
jgi:hypothetical protein